MRRILAASVLLPLLLASDARAQSLRGSPASLDRQNRVARQHDFTYLRSGSQVQRFARLGLLVELPGNAHYELAHVSFPYARPEVKLFVERLARQYHAACGERLVVTSLTRPRSHQPRNASDRSVHPTGMALDLRLSTNSRCRTWLENVLLSLEGANLLEATRERHPPHYHVALFPQPYERYVSTLEARDQVRTASLENGSGSRAASDGIPGGSGRAGGGSAAGAAAASDAVRYTVGRGDTLWGIARRNGLSVDELKEVNGLQSPRIYAGQVLTVPVR